MTRYLRTEMVQLDQLTPYPGNARRGRVDVIMDSIQSNGQYRSLVVREVKSGGLTVLAGNHTMQAIAELNGSKARCEVIECDDETARRINLVDNRSNDLAEDDEEALTVLMRQLTDGAAGTGYTEKQLAAYTKEPELPQMPEPEEVSKTGPTNISAEYECPECGHRFST